MWISTAFFLDFFFFNSQNSIGHQCHFFIKLLSNLFLGPPCCLCLITCRYFLSVFSITPPLTSRSGFIILTLSEWSFLAYQLPFCHTVYPTLLVWRCNVVFKRLKLLNIILLIRMCVLPSLQCAGNIETLTLCT